MRGFASGIALIAGLAALDGCSAPRAPEYAHAGPSTGTSLAAALAGPQRSERDRARDVYRHPRETLEFFGVASTQNVLEIEPGGGWYTEILAPWLRADGHLYEAPYIGPHANADSAGHRPGSALQRRLDAAPDLYGHVVFGTLHDGRFEGFDAQGRFDTVLTFRNIHNWIKDGQLDANLRAFYAALKPGGVLGVEEHRARPGTPLAQMIDSGYVTEAFVIQHAEAAGFVLAARSEVNANPRDTTAHPHGVWSLPPTYAGGDTDRAQYAAIGESDRMTLKFVKR